MVVISIFQPILSLEVSLKASPQVWREHTHGLVEKCVKLHQCCCFWCSRPMMKHIFLGGKVPTYNFILKSRPLFYHSEKLNR